MSGIHLIQDKGYMFEETLISLNRFVNVLVSFFKSTGFILVIYLCNTRKIYYLKLTLCFLLYLRVLLRKKLCKTNCYNMNQLVKTQSLIKLKNKQKKLTILHLPRHSHPHYWMCRSRMSVHSLCES